MNQTNIILDLICFTVTFVWSVLFFIRRDRSRSVVFAGQIFLGVSLIFLLLVANQLHYLSLSLVLNFFYPFLLPSVLILSIFYLHSVFKSKTEFPVWYSLLYVLPVLISAIYNHAFYFHYPLKEVLSHFYDLPDQGLKQEAFKLIHNARKLLFWVMVLCQALVVAIQVTWITIMIRRQMRNFSVKRAQLLKKLFWICLISIVFGLASIIHFNFSWWYVFTRVFWISVFFMLGWKIFYSIPKKNRGKYDLKRYLDDHLKTLLLEYFEKSKPWLNPNLKEDDVILYLRTNRTYFWKLLNDDLSTNFNAFVNQYRLKEVLRLLDQEKKITMLELVEQTGFKNYSTFLKVFQKEKGMTPSEYIRKQKDF